MTTVSGHSDTSDSWSNCASEGDHCYPSSKGLVTMRYGEGENYTYIVTEGFDRIACNDFWGSPSDSSDNKCAYTTANLLGVTPDDSFKKIADEGDSFTLANVETVGDQMHWIRYGAEGTWIYTVMANDGSETMACTNDYFNYNPLDGTDKTCEYSQAAYYELSDPSSLQECASEGQPCDVNSGDVVLIRYGAENLYNWRFIHSGNAQYECANETFGADPVQVAKRCDWMTVSPAAISTIGRWIEVTSCGGAGCSISQVISVGTSRTNTWSFTDQWQTSVTESVEESFTIAGTGDKVSEQVSISFASSAGYQTALTESVTVSTKAVCDPVDGETRWLYQFQTDTTEDCLENASCSGTTLTTDYQCVSNPPAGYAGPECVPGYCIDQNLCLEPCNY
ncbi:MULTISPECIES: hypothetical protein [unclassified Shimia]|uniref:hypothetical protein n=1 Tax=unclassified Shimia TaxID=2630038 RepID=UPI003340E108